MAAADPVKGAHGQAARRPGWAARVARGLPWACRWAATALIVLMCVSALDPWGDGALKAALGVGSIFAVPALVLVWMIGRSGPDLP